MVLSPASNYNENEIAEQPELKSSSKKERSIDERKITRIMYIHKYTQPSSITNATF